MINKTDDTLLSLSREQYEKYLSLSARAKNEKINIELIGQAEEISLPSLSDIAVIISSIEEQARLILDQKGDDGAFFTSSAPSSKEKEELMRVYYTAVNKISALSGELDAKFISLGKQKLSLEESYRQSVLRYQDFLPYKLALGELGEYANEIEALDAELKSDVQRSLDALKLIDTASDVIISAVETVIPEFLSKGARATGAPPYPELSKRELFSAARDLCGQLSAQRSRLAIR